MTKEPSGRWSPLSLAALIIITAASLALSDRSFPGRV
jgi:hypothetical protein